MRLVLSLALASVLTGCAARSPRVSTQAAAVRPDFGYIDLQPGWRLQVVTPIVRSGGYRLRAGDQQMNGNTMTLSVGSDFLGYETAHYAVTARNGAGVRVEFNSAEVTKEGQTSPQPRPVAHLFRLPRGARFVRLIYLVRMSAADHDMAVAAAGDTYTLELLTKRLLAGPAEACRSEGRSFCSWIPQGIAVVPEVRRTVDGVWQWVPVR